MDQFEHYLPSTLQIEELIALIRASKHYDPIPYILRELEKEIFYENNQMACRQYLRPLPSQEQPAYQLYIDLFVAGEQELCKTIRKKCSINNELFIELAVARNVDICKIDPKRCKKYLPTFFSAILMYDSLPLYLKWEIPVLTYFSRRIFVSNAVFHFSEKILRHKVESGANKDIFISIFRKRPLSDAEKEFLRWMCAETDYSSILNSEFSSCPDRKLPFLLELGAKPSVEQKQKLRIHNPTLYKQLFEEDV